ncbi:6-phosphofructokinase [Alkalicoccus halolimnae]|uniref:ATP-dependent 6-phosphofructokinase n=1 Tax=Alkalicoccus halolimnae TaxID=1667239 RepID=A0A5C7FLG1_9BACI|nr:6-phosphofructokinase [Alkalicoccus halolimnae]TXF87184.1 6-phosphofructokinase [Alkalicoccus halolimnae]
MKNVAVLTSGGDSPGMNAAIRAVVRTGLYYNLNIFGVKKGYEGLLSNDIKKMNASSVGDIIHKGGTFLKTSRSEEFMTENGRKKAVENLKTRNIEGLVVIGGDGSFRGAQTLSREGIATIGIPGTIDNDLAYTDFTIGFDTAVNTVLEAVTKIRDTSTSHEKTTIIEVMGRYCGDLALYAGICGGAESIIVPEDPLHIDEIAGRINKGKERGKLHHIIMLAEGAGDAKSLQKDLIDKTGESARISVLGFIQRGGDPTAGDRLLASRMGVKAVEELLKFNSSKVIGVRNNQLFSEDIDQALGKKKALDTSIYSMAEILSL